MKTPIYDKHIERGAKIVDFSGWEMPVRYTSIIEEHLAVREFAGIFDVSHMGRISVTGPDAEKFLDYLSTNKIAGKREGTATYTVLPDPDGRCLDDVIVYKQDSNRFFIIANASNRDKDKKHLIEHSKGYEVEIEDHFSGEGLIAVQGPKAIDIISRMIPGVELLKPMTFAHYEYQGREIIVSRTGYTGSDGVEISCNDESIRKLWDRCLENDVKPIGLGARDTLRLEKGYALYGHELTEEIFPNETVSAWTIKWDKPDFLGKQAMLAVESSNLKRKEYGVVLKEKGIPREGYEVLQDDRLIGKVTSGTFSPCLQAGIAIILVNIILEQGSTVEIQIRDRKIPGEVVNLPFYKN